MSENSDGRVLFDVSTAMRWTGPPVGIVRAQRELALWAHGNVANVAFVFFDAERQAYCEVLGDVRRFLRGEAGLDTLGLTNPAAPGQPRTDRIPALLRLCYGSDSPAAWRSGSSSEFACTRRGRGSRALQTSCSVQ